MTLAFVVVPPSGFTLATGLVGFSVAMLGAVVPDLDEPLADSWDRIPAGSIIGKILYPLLGGHRMISHSLLGLWIMNKLAEYVLNWAKSFLIVDIEIVKWCFLIGYASHLILDSITREGVPWLFPIPIKLGFPPIKRLRMITGGWQEKILVFPGLVAANAYLIYSHYPLFLDIFTKRLIR